MVEGKVRAGFPSPADDFALKELDLMELLVQRPLATFFWEVAGTSMEGLGIGNKDLLVVDRSLKPRHGSIVVAEFEGGFVVKQLHKRAGAIKLMSANPEFPEITLQEGQQLTICGVVTSVVKRFTN
jgi:DNA polymerase V